MVRQEGKTRSVKPWPLPCEECTEEDKVGFGCGFDDKLRGKGTTIRDRFPKDKTCPEYYARSPFVISVHSYLRAYRTGGLGNVMDLPATLFEYLQILDSEDEYHLESVKAELMSDGD